MVFEVTSEDYLDFFRDRKVEVTNAICNGIEVAFETQQDVANVFEVDFIDSLSVYEVSIDKKDWSDTLTSCMNIFQEHNESDMAIDAYMLKKKVEGGSD